MANIEKHPKRPVDELEQADFSQVPTHARNSRLVGQHIKNRKPWLALAARPDGQAAREVVLRLEGMPRTPRNLSRIRKRIEELNRNLAESGTPVRLRVLGDVPR